MSTGVSVEDLVSIIQDCLENPSPNRSQFDEAVQLVHSFLPHTPCEQNAIDITDGYQSMSGQYNSGSDVTKESQQPQSKGWFGQLLDSMCNPELYAKGFHWLAPHVTVCCVIVPVCVNMLVCFKQVERATILDEERMKALEKGSTFDTREFLTEQLTSMQPGLAKIIEWVFDCFLYCFLGVLVSHIAPTVLPLLGVPTWLSALLSGTGQGVSSCLTLVVSLLGKIPWRGIVKNTCFLMCASFSFFVLLVIGIVMWEDVLYCWTNAWSYLYCIVYYVVTKTFVALCVLHCTVGKLHAFLFKCHFVGELRAHQEELEVHEVQIETLETSLSEVKTKEEKWIDVLCTVSIIAVQCMDFTEGYVLQRYFFGLLARLVWLVLESSSDCKWRYDSMEWPEFDMCKKYAANALQRNKDTQSDLKLPDVLAGAYPDHSKSVFKYKMKRSIWMPKQNHWNVLRADPSVTFNSSTIDELLPFRCFESTDSNCALKALIDQMKGACQCPPWTTNPVISELVKACNEENKSSAFRTQVSELKKATVQNDNDSLTTPLEKSENPPEFEQLQVKPCDQLLMKHCFTIVAMVLGVLLSLFLWVNSPTLTTVEYPPMVEDKNGNHPIPEFFKPSMCDKFTNSTHNNTTYKATFYECEEQNVEGDVSKNNTKTTKPPEMPKNVSLVEIFHANGLCLGKHWNTAKGKVDVTYSSQYQEAKCHVRDAFETLAHLLREWAFPIRNLKKLTAEYLLKQVEKFQSNVQALGNEAINTVKETVKYVKKVRIWLQSFVVKGVSFGDLPWHDRLAICLLATIIRLVLQNVFNTLS